MFGDRILSIGDEQKLVAESHILRRFNLTPCGKNIAWYIHEPCFASLYCFLDFTNKRCIARQLLRFELFKILSGLS